MALPPAPMEGRPNPLDTSIVPREGITHEGVGPVAMWIMAAMAKDPSPGTIGRMELLKIWDALPRDGRKKLIQAGRVLLAREQEK